MPKNDLSRRILSRQEKQDLDIEIGFMEGLLKKDPHYVEAMQILGDDYTRRGRLDDGLRVDETLAKMRPDDPMVHYNLACSLSLTKQLDAALRALENALNLGYRDFKWLKEDPDLANLRQHPLFRKIRAKIRSLQTK